MPLQKWTLLLILTLSLAAGLFAVSHTRSQDAESETRLEPAPRRVRVATVEAVDRPRQLGFSGVTRAVDRARLAFSIGGRLLERPVEIGDRVRAGQTLARLDDRETRNALTSARAVLAESRSQLAQLQRDLERVEQLVEAKAATREELEQATAATEGVEAAVEAAQARLREAERLAAETRLTAPFDATVSQVFQQPGEFLQPGQPVVVLSGDGEVEVEVEVPESLILQIQPGDRATVVMPAVGEPLEATIRSVGRSATGVGGLFPVIARLDADPRLVAGMTAEVLLRLRDAATLAVPVEAVVNPGGRRPSVFRVVDGDGGPRVERLEVEVLHLLEASVTVRGLLEAGDRVVAAGQHALLDGDRVEIER